MTTILISTVYNPDSVLMACTKLSPDKLVLLATKPRDNKLKKALELIKSSLGRVLDISIVDIPEYDIVGISKKMVDTIDSVSLEGTIVVNITSGRKTQSLGALFGAYARFKYVKRITYYPEGDQKGEVVQLPIMKMKLTDSQEKILTSIKANKIQSYKTLAENTGLSTAMVYRAVDDLIQQGLIEKTKDEGIVLTNAGEIAIL